jgi:O-antigen ligase
MTSIPAAGPFSRVRLERSADVLAALLAASLPWSTSATSILAVVWVVVLVPTLDPAPLLRLLRHPAALLPVVLFALAVLGLAWGGTVPWSERFSGFGQFAKLVAILPLLMQFARSENGHWPLLAFFASATVLLVYSWLLVVFPSLPSNGYPQGVPVKDYVIQSEIFAVCVFALFDRAIAASKEARWRDAALLVVLALIFIANIAFVATARTTLVIMAVLFVLLGLRHFNRIQLAVFFAAVVACAAIVWTSSPYLRDRISHVSTDIDKRKAAPETSTGARLYFWKQSLTSIQEAPLIGHGTGSVREAFRRVASDPAQELATNPHNQVFAVGMQLGAIGIVVLLAMWLVHWRLFLGPDATAWIGLVVVAQNVVGSLFNSHLFDFTQGWLYVVGVGVAGGMMLRQQGKP